MNIIMTPAIRLIISVVGFVGLIKGVEYMTKKRVFISFAIEDKRLRDFLVAQSRNDNSPFEFVDMSVKQPWDNAWKTNCRSRIKGCHGVVAIVTGNSLAADGQRWEIKCAKEEGVPVLPMYGGDTHKNCRVPSELGTNARVLNWSWSNIANFISRL